MTGRRKDGYEIDERYAGKMEGTGQNESKLNTAITKYQPGGRALTIGWWLVIGTRLGLNLEPKYSLGSLPETIGADGYSYASTTSWTDRELQSDSINVDT